MAVLIDPPRWPAHGTVFGHLVSDSSLHELHAFARRAGIPPRAFDHDHYDVPVSRYDELVAAGAVPLDERELVRRLARSGLRVRPHEKTPTRVRARAAVVAAWERLGLPGSLRDTLMTRWSEPHRHYHDVRHLAQCLSALGHLGSDDPVVEVAAWFHDAVYDGVPGQDEERSAALAETLLDGVMAAGQVAEVSRLVRMTADHSPDDPLGAFLSDADLSILGQIPGRYHVYVRDVRLDYAHVDDDAWRVGRAAVLRSLLGQDPLYRTVAGRDLWEARARANLADELARLDA
ncbi:DUF4031 domain-containing protein [Tessaracoccus sp. G1721]